MKLLCKKNYYGFEEGKYYKVASKTDNHIIVESDESIQNYWYRFVFVKLSEYDKCLYDYFTSITEERKLKLKQLSKIKS